MSSSGSQFPAEKGMTSVLNGLGEWEDGEMKCHSTDFLGCEPLVKDITGPHVILKIWTDTWLAT